MCWRRRIASLLIAMLYCATSATWAAGAPEREQARASVSELHETAGTVTIDISKQSGLSRAARRSAPANFPPFDILDSNVLVDIGTTASGARNTWTSLPPGFALGGSGGVASDTAGFIPGINGYIQNSTTLSATPDASGTIYMLVDRRAISIDDSESTTIFFDSTGNTTADSPSPGYQRALLWYLTDAASTPQIWAVGQGRNAFETYLYMGGVLAPLHGKYLNSHVSNMAASPHADPTYAEVVFTWHGNQYYEYIDGNLHWAGRFPSTLGAGIYSYITIGNNANGPGSAGRGLGNFPIIRFQLSSAYCPPSFIRLPLVGVYGDSFTLAGQGSVDVTNLVGSPTRSQVDGVQLQTSLQRMISVGNTGRGYDNWVQILQTYVWRTFGGYTRFYSSGQSGHTWCSAGFPGSGNATATYAIDDFVNNAKTGFSDAMNSARPEAIVAIGSVNDVNVGTPADIIADYKTHLDYWANSNPSLKQILLIETLSWELGSPLVGHTDNAGWIAEMARQRGLLRATFNTSLRYMADGRVPVVYVPTYETWVQGPNSVRYLNNANPDNTTPTANNQPNSDGHPDAEGHIKIADLIWPYLYRYYTTGSFY